MVDDEGCVLSHPPTHQLAFWVFCLWQIADVVMFKERNHVADDEGCVLLLYLPLTRQGPRYSICLLVWFTQGIYLYVQTDTG